MALSSLFYCFDFSIHTSIFSLFFFRFTFFSLLFLRFFSVYLFSSHLTFFSFLRLLMLSARSPLYLSFLFISSPAFPSSPFSPLFFPSLSLGLSFPSFSLSHSSFPFHHLHFPSSPITFPSLPFSFFSLILHLSFPLSTSNCRFYNLS